MVNAVLLKVFLPIPADVIRLTLGKDEARANVNSGRESWELMRGKDLGDIQIGDW